MTKSYECIIKNQFEPIKALQCTQKEEDNLDSYTFVRPVDRLDWYQLSQDEQFEVGHLFQVSKTCNPNFINSNYNHNCDDIKNQGGCDFIDSAIFLVFWSQWNTKGHLETFLQCPQCGCGSDGAANLNDLYAAEQEGSRTFLDVANTMYNNRLE